MKIKKAFQGTIPENKILNTKSTSQTDTYSCDYINEITKDIYSTDELLTNQIWIDGKPIYRKVINKSVPSNTIGQIGLSGLNYDTIWVNQGKSFNQYSGTQTSSPTNWINSDFNDYGLCYINDERILNIKNKTNSDRTYYITLEYTKA